MGISIVAICFLLAMAADSALSRTPVLYGFVKDAIEHTSAMFKLCTNTQK